VDVDWRSSAHPILGSWLRLGRPLTKDEVRWVQEMARRIAAILLLEAALDENYRAVKAHTYEWGREA
jgi:hypothetical protein